MKAQYRWMWGLLGLSLLLAGCSSDGDSYAKKSSGSSTVQAPADAEGGSPASGAVSAEHKSAAPASPASGKTEGAAADAKVTLAALTDSEPDRFLIKNATLSIETPDVRKAGSQLVTTAQKLKGYTSDSHEAVDSLGSRSLTVQVRVPAQQFDTFVHEVEALGKVLDNQVTAQDVTEEFVDSQAKLRNLKKTEERLIEHLSKTGKLSDTLLIETELTRVREGIEELEGKVRFMAHRISFSTISVTFKEAARPQSMTPPETYSAGQVTSEAMRSFIGFLQNSLSMVIWLAIWSVVWVPLLLLIRYVVRKAQKSAAQNRESLALARQNYMAAQQAGQAPPMPPINHMPPPPAQN